MRGGAILCAILFFSFMHVKAQKSAAMQDSIALVKVWRNFRQAIVEKNDSTLRRLSVDSIYCSQCDKYMLSNKAYRSQQERVYVSSEHFFREDMPRIANYIGHAVLSNSFILHDEDINRKLFTKKLDENHLVTPVRCYSIFITIVESTAKREGMQGCFTFVKTKEGFKFCGYSTVP